MVPGTVRLFRFTFGDGRDYDLQMAVVMAESANEARQLLKEDLERQRKLVPPGSGKYGYEGDNGFNWYFTEHEPRGVMEATGPVVYTYGVDG